MLNPSPNVDDLRVLLERLYPDIRISGPAVALLAEEMAELENECDPMHTAIQYHLDRNPRFIIDGVPILFAQTTGRGHKHGTHNYTK